MSHIPVFSCVGDVAHTAYYFDVHPSVQPISNLWCYRTQLCQTRTWWSGWDITEVPLLSMQLIQLSTEYKDDTQMEYEGKAKFVSSSSNWVIGSLPLVAMVTEWNHADQQLMWTTLEVTWWLCTGLESDWWWKQSLSIAWSVIRTL